MRILRSQILMTVLVPLMLGSSFAETKAEFHYRLKVQLDPVLHKLEAEGWILQPPSSRFYLHKSLVVRQVSADGNEVSFHTDSSVDPSLQAKLGTPVIVEATNPQQLHVTYGGEIRDVIWECNMNAPDLVELALYSAWYPMFQGMKDFTFELEVSMPAGFVVTTNGMCKRQSEQKDRSTTEWSSYAPGIDIVILGSPLLHKLEGGLKETKAEIYYHSISDQLIKSKIDNLLRGMARLSALYGPPLAKGVLRIVYTPRSGQGYSRIPLIVVSEERAQKTMTEEFGEASDFRNNCHEVSHFWWMLADPNTPDDWINEGLAEFSALRISEELFGKAFAEIRIGEYRQNARESRTSDAIAETQSSSPDREVNRYDKPTLLLREAQSKFGQEALDRVFKTLYTRFAETHNATTASFLEEAGKQMGRDAETFFREALYRKNAISQPAGKNQ